MQSSSALITISFLLIAATVESLDQLKINSGSSSTIYDGRFPLAKSWDNKPDTFFHARSNTNGWAKYNIPQSTVALVRLQNRHNCCEDRMTGNVVYVCASQSDSSCKECGRVTSKIGKSAWAEIKCSLSGSVVKVAATNSYLQIAQIEVFSAPETMERLKINSGSSSTIYDNRFPLAKSWDTDKNSFFHAKSNTNGWAKYNIPESNVGLVRLQNRHSCCEERMTGNVVYVCASQSDSSCKECGRVTSKIGRSAWAEIRCALRGSVVKVAATNSYLQIATIEVFGGQGNMVEDNAGPSGVGHWGGSCTCPDGSVFQVGDNYDACKSLACIGGTPGKCNRGGGVWSRRRVTCAPPKSKNIVQDNAGVGGWGGTCVCPDGEVYQVGDNIDSCKSLACIGGTSGTCNRHDGPWSNRKVTCDPAIKNIVKDDDPTVGGWGGSCTCPDGSVYQVGDNYDACKSLACIGGTSGKCNGWGGPWSKRKVTCAPGNVVIDNAPRVGHWGGSCTCPDGSVYQVGDNYDACRSLACIGGTPGKCTRGGGIWSRRKVTCA